MTSDVRLSEDAVLVQGALGLGTDAPRRPLHVEGQEIHSGGGGAGFSFADRSTGGFVDTPTKGERWVLYAAAGAARLWSGQDALTVSKTAEAGRCDAKLSGHLEVAGRLVAESLTKTKLFAVVAEELRGGTRAGLEAVECRAQAVTLDHPKALVDRDVIVPTDALRGGSAEALPKQQPPQPPGPRPDLPHKVTVHEPRLALFHDFTLPGGGADALVLNHLGRYTGGVRVEGSLHVEGDLTHGSSGATKEDVRALGAADAREALAQLRPVTFRGAGSDRRRAGFVAEEVPELLAHPDRDRIAPTEVVALLAAAFEEQGRLLEEQGRLLEALSERVAALEAGG